MLMQLKTHYYEKTFEPLKLDNFFRIALGCVDVLKTSMPVHTHMATQRHKHHAHPRMHTRVAQKSSIKKPNLLAGLGAPT